MLSAGQHIGNYRVIRQLGQGGMGTVYEVIHQVIGRRSAIKLIAPDIARDPEWVQRFINEARAVNLICHPNIVEIYEFGSTADGAPYIVMELLTGQSLDEKRLSAGGRLLRQAPAIFAQLARALAAAHEKGVVHRDLKPANVMLVAAREEPGQERVKVLDFGIAKLAAGSAPSASVPLDENVPRTGKGTRLGTPEYMAPEQCLDAGEVDAKADVYMLGVMLYEMVCGQRPFLAKVAVELMTQHVREEPPLVKSLAPDVPEGLVALIHAMLLKDPEERPSMAEVAERLGRLSNNAVAQSESQSGSGPVTSSLPSLSSAPSLVSAALGPRQVRAFGMLRALLWLGVAVVVAALTSAAWWRAGSQRTNHDAPRAAALLPPRQAPLLQPSTPAPAPPGPEPASPIENGAPPLVPQPTAKATESKHLLDKRPAAALPKEAAPSPPLRTLLFEDLPPIDREK